MCRSRTVFTRAVFTMLMVLGFAATAAADPRMYTGSLILHTFGNDTTTGLQYPFSTAQYIGIPLTGKCNTGPYHAKETLTFPSTPDYGRFTVFTIPAYGGQVPTVDTNSDTVPDVPEGCVSISRGDPLTGSGTISTTGAAHTSRATSDPRGFAIPQFELNKVKLGEATMEPHGVFLWGIHYVDLHNDTGVLQKSGGDGSFAVSHTGQARRKAIQSAGQNQFGGVMRLLGSYHSAEGYAYGPAGNTSVHDLDWLINYVGNGGQATSGGVVTAGYTQNKVMYGRSVDSGSYYYRSFTNFVEVFKWTTGTVQVTARGLHSRTVLERNGYDARTPMGSGVVQLVSPMLTHRGSGYSPSAAIGIMKITFVPEPGSLIALGAGASMLGLLAGVQRYKRREE